MRHRTGIPNVKYEAESHASRLPEKEETTIHTRMPDTNAVPYSQPSFFMRETVRSGRRHVKNPVFLGLCFVGIPLPSSAGRPALAP